MTAIDYRATLMESGQCFRWRETPLGYGAVLQGRAVFLREGTPVQDAFLRNYLDLDRDYDALARSCAKWPVLQNALSLYPGLHVLNQPAWDAVVQFILSANNNVPRITRMVQALSERYGERVDTGVGALYALPAPETLAACGEDELRGLGVGYRAPYLIKTARLVCEGFPLEELSVMPYEDAHQMLLRLPGVGGKVADCILLFGCSHASAFPVDVWVERLLGNWFALKAKNRDELKKLARATFGDQAGLLQQYLFHAARMGAIPTETIHNRR